MQDAASPSRTASASPNADHTVAPSFDHIPISNTDALDDSWRFLLLGLGDAGAAVPVPPLDLVVHLDHILAGSAYNTACVEHHARDGVVKGKGIVDGPGSEIPYLSPLLVPHPIIMTKKSYPYAPVQAARHEVDVVEL